MLYSRRAPPPRIPASQLLGYLSARYLGSGVAYAILSNRSGQFISIDAFYFLDISISRGFSVVSAPGENHAISQ